MKGLLLIYVLTFAGTILALVRPKIGLYLYVGYAVLRPRSIWGYAGNLENISLIVGSAMLLGWALNGFGTWRLGRGKSILTMLLVFTVWTTMSAVLATNPTVAFGAVVELLKITLPFLVGMTMLETERDWRPLMWTIVIAQGYVGFEMNLNYLRGYNSAAIGFGGMDNNCFGASLVTVVGLALALALSAEKYYQRGLALLAAALILHTTLLTFSRGAMVGLVAVGMIAFLLMPKRPTYIAALVLTALIAARFTGPELTDRYATIFASEGERDGSAESRLDLWMDCLKVVESAPVFGVGPWNWRVVAASYGWPEGKSAHSVWMETAAETGIPGALSLLAFFSMAAFRLWTVARFGKESTRREQVLAAGVVMSMVGFIVAGQFVSVTGLEVPYYVALLSAVILKTKNPSALASSVPTQRLSPVFNGDRSRVARVGL